MIDVSSPTGRAVASTARVAARSAVSAYWSLTLMSLVLSSIT